MIPISLKITGFLSYRETVELDFTTFSLACISGHNGAGKSSLLDAITWALFGQARKRDEALVNLQSKAAEVVYTFSYENNAYRIQRSMPRGKKKMLEFQIQDGERWRPLTEATMRATQERIERILRLDYETFVNAAFFLQGRADQFTQQNASKRKDVLGNILGLEIWDVYKTRTALRRRNVEQALDTVEGRIAEINAELAEEEPRKAHLTALETQLERLSAARKTQETVVENIRRLTASLEDQRKLTNKLLEALQRSQNNHAELAARRAARADERSRYADLLARADEVDAAYAAWQESRAALARWDATAAQFHEQDAKRQPFLQEINAEKARLEQELALLEKQAAGIKNQETSIRNLKTQIELAEKDFAEAERKAAAREAFQKEQAAAREKYAALKAENEQFKAEMDVLKARIERFSAIEAAACPLCGQDLSETHRAETLAKMKKDGKAQGDQYRANTAAMNAIFEEVQNYAARDTQYKTVDQDLLSASTKLTQLQERLVALLENEKQWEAEGKKRLAALRAILEDKNFSTDARANLAAVDAELKRLGYDAAAHDAARSVEMELRVAEDDFRALEAARAALTPLDDEIAHLDVQISELKAEIDAQRLEYDRAQATLEMAESQTPDENAAYAELLKMQEQENQLNQEVGAARQKVAVLNGLRIRKTDYESERESFAVQIARYKKLERAFSRDGVPALLIEQALPEIEEKANDLLNRLSNGQMSIRFVTQAAYKDSKRADMKETLDIQISDSAGIRDYEMFSGGEAFRVNFAIRLALSKALSQRKGARLQTLIIDEGFGSQDAQGRQRLIEAINQVRGDFAKILVITHLESLKDAFPTQIIVEKGETGSQIRVV